MLLSSAGADAGPATHAHGVSSWWLEMRTRRADFLLPRCPRPRKRSRWLGGWDGLTGDSDAVEVWLHVSDRDLAVLRSGGGDLFLHHAYQQTDAHSACGPTPPSPQGDFSDEAAMPGNALIAARLKEIAGCARSGAAIWRSGRADLTAARRPAFAACAQAYLGRSAHPTPHPLLLPSPPLHTPQLRARPVQPKRQTRGPRVERGGQGAPCAPAGRSRRRRRPPAATASSAVRAGLGTNPA